MKRLFVFTVAISFLLIAFSVEAVTPDPAVPLGKSFYSSRPPRAKTIVEGTPTLAPQNPGIPTPYIVRDEPIPAQQQPGKAKPQSSLEFSGTTFDQLAPTPQSVAEQYPLSSITVGNPNGTKKLIAQRTTDDDPVQPKVRETQEDEIDTFNARLANIQLEKHNFSETLRLIEKIKSPQFKVRTLVDLAEYVSRDSNYKKEADQLYALSLEGIDALVKGETFVIKIKDEQKFDRVPSASGRKSLTLIEEDAPTAPKESVSILAPVPKKPAVTLLEEEPVNALQGIESTESKKDNLFTAPTLAPPASKSLLADTPEDATKAPAEETGTKTPKRPSIFLSDRAADDNETKTPETPQAPVKAVPIPAPEQVPAPDAEKTETGPIPLLSTTESLSKIEIKPSDPSTAPTKRAMPPKKAVKLEEN